MIFVVGQLPYEFLGCLESLAFQHPSTFLRFGATQKTIDIYGSPLYARLRRTTRRLARLGRVSGCRWSGRVALAAPNTGEGQQRGQTWQSMQSCSGIQSCQSIERLQGVIPWCQREEQGRISMAQYYYSRSTSCATRHTLLWQMRVYSRCSRCSHRGGAELPEDKYA